MARGWGLTTQLTLDGIRGPFGVHDPLGRCYTEQPLADAIVAALDLAAPPAMVLEPSVGGGSFARAARRRWPGSWLIGVDIDPDAAGFAHCDTAMRADFLGLPDDWQGPDVDLIVGNPDFGRKDPTVPLAHARACVGLDPTVCALILPLGYLGIACWAGFLAEHPPKWIRRIIGRPWEVVREVAVYEWHRGHAGPSMTVALPGWAP